MVSISSIDKAFDEIRLIDKGIEKCDAKYVMRHIKKATIYGDQTYYEAGEDPEKRLAIHEKIGRQINRFDEECMCHKV